jgi:hypothetical protein
MRMSAMITTKKTSMKKNIDPVPRPRFPEDPADYELPPHTD